MKRVGCSIFLAVVGAISALGLRSSFGESIPLQVEDGTFVVPVRINDKITLDFTLDSGASDVTIPADVFSTLRRTHTISDSDLIGTMNYQLVDGSTRQAMRFRLRSIRVGDVELHDVVGSVAPPNGSLLLGESFLTRLTNWSVDNRRHVLIINEDLPSSDTDNAATTHADDPGRTAQGGSASPPLIYSDVETLQQEAADLRREAQYLQAEAAKLAQSGDDDGAGGARSRATKLSAMARRMFLRPSHV
jgi:clan AA aspartic protease (TIGR02281 family)